MNNNVQNTSTWPTTFGAIGIVIGGLSLFGAFLSLSGMSEIEQLQTATPFSAGVLNEQISTLLDSSGPSQWVESIVSIVMILLSLVLIGAGMALQQRTFASRAILLYWAAIYVATTMASTIWTWAPRRDLIASSSEVKGIFVAHLVISLPLSLAFPTFLLWWLNRHHIRNETALWR